MLFFSKYWVDNSYFLNFMKLIYLWVPCHKVFGLSQRALTMRGWDLCHQDGKDFVRLKVEFAVTGPFFLSFANILIVMH